METPISQNISSPPFHIDLVGGVQSQLSTSPWTQDYTHDFGLYNIYIIGQVLWVQIVHSWLMSDYLGSTAWCFMCGDREEDPHFLESGANLILS